MEIQGGPPFDDIINACADLGFRAEVLRLFPDFKNNPDVLLTDETKVIYLRYKLLPHV
jgi:hypothetical protein